VHETMIEAINREKQIKTDQGRKSRKEIRVDRSAKPEMGRPLRDVDLRRPAFKFRHCERSEAIHRNYEKSMDCFVATLLAMTNRSNECVLQSTFAGAGCSVDAFATRAAVAIPASAAIFFCGSEPGCTTPADMIRVAASSALMSISMILLLGT
jgi:hypothetical protein